MWLIRIVSGLFAGFQNELRLLSKCRQPAKKTSYFEVWALYWGKMGKMREWKPQIAYSTSMTARPPTSTSYLWTLKFNENPDELNWNPDLHFAPLALS